MASQNVLKLTDGNFENEVLKSPIPVMVHFWATWSGPCRQLSPHIGTIADKYQGKIKVFELDIDANQESPSKYSVRAVPTVIVFQGGQIKGSLSGVTTFKKLVELLGY